MITVFIPSFNHSPYILQSIELAKKIPVKNKVIFIVDDKSSDDSVSKIESYLSKTPSDEEIIFIKNERNMGVVSSLNRCLDQCKTEYIYLMASDDLPDGNGLKCLFDKMEGKKSLQFVIGGGNNFFPDGSETPIYDEKHFTFFNLSSPDRYKKIFLDCPSPILSQSTLIRTAALRHIGGWDPKIIADDYAMFMQLLTSFPDRGKDFDFLPDIICVRYRHHGENSYHKLFRQYLMTVQALEKFAPKSLIKASIGYKFAYYFLYAISKYQFRVCVNLISKTNVKYWGWGLIGALKTLIHRVPR